MRVLDTLDLFSGVGGFSLALEWAGGFQIVAFCESDKKCRLVLNKHWPSKPVFTDIKELTIGSLAIEGITGIDVIVGGFPCQDVSTAGPGKGISGERSGLWGQFKRLIGEIRPRYAIIENVAALRYKEKGLYRVLADLAEIGYDAEWHCIPASAVGAPHQRDRIWIIAYPRHKTRVIQPGIKRQAPTEKSTGLCEGRVVPDAHKQHGNGGRYEPSKVCRERSSKTYLQGSKPNVPDTRGPEPRRLPSSEREEIPPARSDSQNVPDSESKLRECARDSWLGRPGLTDCNQWQIEPDVGRVVDGFPGRVDRLKQLGNAVVPQIPYVIGKAIMEIEGIGKQEEL